MCIELYQLEVTFGVYVPAIIVIEPVINGNELKSDFIRFIQMKTVLYLIKKYTTEILWKLTNCPKLCQGLSVSSVPS